jgi:hypothetical protein
MLTKLRPVAYRQNLLSVCMPAVLLPIFMPAQPLFLLSLASAIKIKSPNFIASFFGALLRHIFYKRSSTNRNVKQAQTFRQGTDCHTVGGFVFPRFAAVPTSINGARDT